MKPQLPITTVVTPCQHDDVPSGSQNSCASMWVWPSMNPGVTTCPSASISWCAPVAHRADLGDAPGVDRDVGTVWGEAGAVDERAIADHEIVCHAHHSLASRSAIGRPRRLTRRLDPILWPAPRWRPRTVAFDEMWSNLRMAASAAEAPIGARPKKAKTDWGKYGRNPVVILALVAFIDSVDRGILPGVLDDVQDDLGFSDFQAGFLGTAFVLAGFVAVLPAGYLADRYRRTRIIAIVLASWGAISALNAAVTSFVQFAIVRAILGVGETVDNPASQSLIADYYKPDLRGRAYAYQRVAPTVGKRSASASAASWARSSDGAPRSSSSAFPGRSSRSSCGG